VYTSLGDLQSETFGSAGNGSVGYSYFPTSAEGGANGSPDAVQTMTISTPASQSGQQGYTYESGGKRLQTITVNGLTITYQYLADSNQLETITVGNVTTTLTPDTSDPSRLGGMLVTAGGQNVYDATYGYNQLDQRTDDSVTETVVADDGTTSSQDASRTYGYDPNQADALTQVKDANGNVLYSYNYDGVGNFKNNPALGSANSVNEYANLTYNLRHDLTNDGQFAYGYDALDRLVSVTPDSQSSGSLAAKYGYDGQGRMLWEDLYTWSGSWVLSTSYHFLWNGNELVAKLDANNNLLQQYTWGPGEDGTDKVQLLTDFTGGWTAHTFELSYDASGNVTMLLDPMSGQVVGSYSYAPYGALLSAIGPEAGICPFGPKGNWTDYAIDPTLAWSQPAPAYVTNRVVDLGYGFWLQDDAAGISGGLNTREYLGDDPINNVDPDGTRFFQASHKDAVAADANSPLPGEVSFGHIRQEAIAAAEAEFHLSGTVPGDQQVAPGKTFQGVVDWYYDKKLAWYEDNAFYAVDDDVYAQDLAAHNQPNNLRADTMTDGQRATSDALMQIRANVTNENADYVLQFYQNNPNPTFLNILFGWANKAVPDMAAAFAGTVRPNPGLPPEEIMPPAEVVRGQTVVPGVGSQTASGAFGPETAQSIIASTAQAQAGLGAQGLRDAGYLSNAQWQAYLKDTSAGGRFFGTAVHEATADALNEAYPGRFLYQMVGPDFIDTATGEVLELTTPGQVGAHKAKSGYDAVTYSTYVLHK
jgi:hypothetical protein